MDVQIKDAEALRRVNPPALRAYLESQNWSFRETWRDRITVWTKEHARKVRQILMPLREDSGSYATRIYEAVLLLAELEDRSQLDVYYDLMGAGADVIRLRSLNKNGRFDESLSGSANLLDCAQKLITAAARFAEQPGSPVYRGRISGAVTDYVRSVRPLPGYGTSSELTLHSRVPAGYGQADMGDDFRSPFERKTTKALLEGLREADKTTIKVNSGEVEIKEAFERAADHGASANLCEAIAALAKQSRGVVVSVSWAEVRPAKASDSEFAFSESSAVVLEKGAQWLRRKSPALNEHVTGEIVRLDKENPGEFDGLATMTCELDGRSVGLHVRFEMGDRDEVVRAFREGIEVSVEGDIYRKGRKHELKNPRHFMVRG